MSDESNYDKVKTTKNHPPPPRSALVPPVSGGQSVTTANAITHFLSLRQGEYPAGGRGWIKWGNRKTAL